MRLEHPQFLWLFVGLIPLWIVLYRERQRRWVSLEQLSAPLDAEYIKKRSKSRDSCMLLSLAFLIIALAGPRWGTRTIPERRSGLDLLFAFDVSNSMLVEDISPNRLERAKKIALEVLSQLEQEGFLFHCGVALGKGQAVLAVPLTSDTESVQRMIQDLSPDIYSSRGTNLSALVEVAEEAFSPELATRKVVLLFSDGETLSGGEEGAFSLSGEKSLRFGVVGVGTPEGGPVPVKGVSSQKGTPIISTLRRDFLQKLALIRGGIYVDGAQEDVVLRLIDFLKPFLSGETQPFDVRKEVIDQRPFFILLALGSLFLPEILVSKRKRTK
ncbi:VWA domain-containing protein [Treponema sp. J25]|uniref:vWA domain-containing protein n=1 Tax=Treponema sp. J25 TaxID=2094121 RepID=UPI00140426B8|nr:VWA domain-containing protein [Treponema sp. J25]